MTAALILLLLASKPAPTRPACQSSPKVVGPCFKVHGKIQVWNGSPSIRISKMGNNRILGVKDTTGEGEGPWIPDEVRISDFYDAYFADFLVCPLTRQREGHMQMVCVESATNAKRTDY